MSDRRSVLQPLIYGALLSAGVWIGGRFAGAGNFDKVEAVLDIVEKEYVDEVDAARRNKLEEKAVSEMLQELDPHSYYFTADETRRSAEQLQGSFKGIGILYEIVRDTVVVVRVTPGSPSENILKQYDRILRADNISLVKMSNPDSIRKQLRGPGGKEVKLTIRRSGSKNTQVVSVVRGDVPISSVDMAFMPDKETGYIRVARFGSETHDEFLRQANLLHAKGMKKMVVDLRGNSGGYLGTAVKLADEFLGPKKKVTYTLSRGGKRDDYDATSEGGDENTPLAILIDENSASASEIVAGAIQDNDRGIIIGRRSYGKGLVQEEKMLPDSSSFRITVSRYYTPSGRCIQRSYSKGVDAYHEEEEDRYKTGELFHADSIKTGKARKFQTLVKKRTVYDAGGIIPDVFIPLDTTNDSRLINRLYRKNCFTLFIFDATERDHVALQKAGLENFLATYKVSDEAMRSFREMAAKEGVTADDVNWNRSDAAIRMYIKASVARLLWYDEGYARVLAERDVALLQAVEELKK
jgi:carboxyl-terminal processing protease